MSTIETVKIKAEITKGNPLGYVVINADDFSECHELYEPSAEVSAETVEASMAEDEAKPDPAAEVQKRPYNRRS